MDTDWQTIMVVFYGTGNTPINAAVDYRDYTFRSLFLVVEEKVSFWEARRFSITAISHCHQPLSSTNAINRWLQPFSSTIAIKRGFSTPIVERLLVPLRPTI